jgi:hypothetical protein
MLTVQEFLCYAKRRRTTTKRRSGCRSDNALEFDYSAAVGRSSSHWKQFKHRCPPEVGAVTSPERSKLTRRLRRDAVSGQYPGVVFGRVSGSNRCRYSSSSWFSSILPGERQYNNLNKPRPLPSASFAIQHSALGSVRATSDQQSAQPSKTT